MIISIISNCINIDGTELTIYNRNFFSAREIRYINFEKDGINNLTISDIPPGIEQSSVKFYSLSDPNTRIIEQNFRYDLVNEAKVWYKFLNKKITIKTRDGSIYEGYLVGGPQCKLTYSYDYYGGKSFKKSNYTYTLGNLLLALDLEKGPIISIPPKDVKEFPELPSDFVVKPTLYWKIYTNSPGKHRVSLSYIASGMDWRCDYNATIGKNDRNLYLSAWVTIRNHSGIEYKNTNVSLIAGAVHKVKEPIYASTVVGGAKGGQGEITEGQFLEQPIFEYHQYDLQGKVTLHDNETKQLKLLNASSVKVKKLYYYDGARFRQQYYMDCRENTYYEAPCNRKVNIFLQFDNSKNNNLGRPLPFGKVRVYKKDKNGIPRFIGEDFIEHTPINEKVKVYMGDAFDITGERIKTEFKSVKADIFPDGSKNPARHIYDENFRITLRNNKKENVEIIVFERLFRWSNWRITASSHNYIKKDARTIEFPVQVPANGKTILTYQ